MNRFSLLWKPAVRYAENKCDPRNQYLPENTLSLTEKLNQ